MNIGENIKKCRIEKGLTQEQLAQIVGVSNQAVSKWETNSSIPDGLLFVPIADALGVTIDNLFGRNTSNEKEIYNGIINIIKQTPHENQMEKVREICWQTQKGLFGTIINENPSYHPDELKNADHSSFITTDTGFTSISNRSEIQFFSLFVEPTEGFKILKNCSEHFRQLFEAMGDENVMKSFFYLYSKPNGYTFEKEVLSKDCEIPDEKIDDVMKKLYFAAYPKEITINGEKRMVYQVSQRHDLIAALVILTEFFSADNLRSIYHLQSDNRTKPYFAE